MGGRGLMGAELLRRHNVYNPGPSQIPVEFLNHFVLEFNHPVSQRVQSGIPADYNVLSGVEFGAVLADNDSTFFNGLVAENFNA